MTRLIGETRPRARKRQGCNACGGSIMVGDVYVRQRCVDEGDMWTWKAHVLCAEATNLIWAENSYDDVSEISRDKIRERVGSFFDAVTP